MVYAVVLLSHHPLFDSPSPENDYNKGLNPEGKTIWDFDKLRKEEDEGTLILCAGISDFECHGMAHAQIDKLGKNARVILWNVKDVENDEQEAKDLKKEIYDRYATYFDEDTDNEGQIVLYTGLYSEC
jgi:hypothetical protein